MPTKLYVATLASAPNPRRAVIFLHEKKLASSFPTLIPLDLAKLEHKKKDFLQKNVFGRLPTLELEDGKTFISESVGICRYFENSGDGPKLFGTTDLEKALIDMWIRRVDLEVAPFTRQAWMSSPTLKKLMPSRAVGTEETYNKAVQEVSDLYSIFDEALSAQPYLATKAFSMADITAYCSIDFARTLVGVVVELRYTHLHRWLKEVESRPSVIASLKPISAKL